MKAFITLLFFVTAQCIAGQNSDQRAGQFMNRKDWFGLQREYSANKDSLSPFIKAMSLALTDYYFNRLESAERSISALLNNHPDELDDESKLSMLFYLSDCLHRLNKNEEAANLMSAICSQLKAARTDESILKPYEQIRDQYRELAGLGSINSVERPDKEIILPLSVDTIKTRTEIIQLHLAGTLNGKKARFLFDTGAGVNAASPEAARKYGMKLLDAATTATGINSGTGGIAIADSLRIGELLFYQVPFYVLDLSTGNKEADKHLENLELIIGIPVIDLLEEVRIDLPGRQLTVPRRPTPNPFPDSNLCFSDGRNLLGELKISNDRLVMKFDTGSSDILFYPGYYQENKEQIESAGRMDTIRYAGFGGTQKDTVYIVNNLPVNIGPANGLLKQATFCTGKTIFGESGSDGLIGMDLFTAFPRVIINLKEMFIQAVEKPDNGVHTGREDRSVPNL